MLKNIIEQCLGLKKHMKPPNDRFANSVKLFLQEIKVSQKPTGFHYEWGINKFSEWFNKQDICLENMTEKNICAFYFYIGNLNLEKKTGNSAITCCRTYLHWLSDSGYLKFNDSNFLKKVKMPRVPHRNTLPLYALDFLKMIEITSRPATCRHYKYTIKKFHFYVEQENQKIDEISRHFILKWQEYLLSKGLGIAQRNLDMILLRVYLRWLYESTLILSPPEFLIRLQDIPKMPKLLPKPISLEIDYKIKKLFIESDTLYGIGFLLMRFTGIRIGELANLSFDCVRTDINGINFLKVPLGKLNNERLVPIDLETLGIIERIKKISKLNNKKENPKLLFIDHLGRSVKTQFSITFDEIRSKLNTNDKIVPHRLRHTYATELLNSGMNLLSIMKLLGHRSTTMTLGYAAIDQETVVKEFFEAQVILKNKYKLNEIKGNTPTDLNSLEMLSDFAKWFNNYTKVNSLPINSRKLSFLNSRTKKLFKDIQLAVNGSEKAKL